MSCIVSVGKGTYRYTVNIQIDIDPSHCHCILCRVCGLTNHSLINNTFSHCALLLCTWHWPRVSVIIGGYVAALLTWTTRGQIQNKPLSFSLLPYGIVGDGEKPQPWLKAKHLNTSRNTSTDSEMFPLKVETIMCKNWEIFSAHSPTTHNILTSPCLIDKHLYKSDFF